MNYIGLDIHKKHIQVQHLRADGVLGLSEKIVTCSSSLLSTLNGIEGPLSISLEAGCNHWWISQLLSDQNQVARVRVVDPRRSRNIGKELSVQKGYGRAKNDRIDAEMLAEADRLNLSAAIYLPTPDQLYQRSLCRHRLLLVQSNSSLSARIQSHLSTYGKRASTKSLLADETLSALEDLPEVISFLISQLLDQYRFIRRQICLTEDQLDQRFPEGDDQIQLLLTIPGVGIVLARMILSEIISITNFQGPKYLKSCSGLAPVEHDSDGKKGPIKLNRHCNYFLKYAFIVAAHGARRHPKYQYKYNQDVKKHGKTRAKINLARKIATSVFWMLTRQQAFK